MTSDRARKKAARAQQAATGQPYTQARRSVQRQTSARAEPVEPPPIDPRDRASYSHHWGDQACYLVLHQGRYYTWITDAAEGSRSVVHHVPSEDVGRTLVDEWQALNILHTPRSDAIEHILLLDPGVDGPICYEATVVDVEGSGLWLACQAQTVAGETTRYVLERFTELAAALTAFADRADAAADQAEQNRALSSPDVVAGLLRYRAAKTRTAVAQARLGDVFRTRWGQPEDSRSLVLAPAGLGRGDLRPVLDGREFIWPRRPVVRPPGSRRPDTPVPRWPSTRSRASSSRWSATRTALYSLGTDGQRTDWPIHDDPQTGERYFAVVANPATMADIVAEAPSSSTSLKGFFGMWFNPPDHRRSP